MKQSAINLALSISWVAKDAPSGAAIAQAAQEAGFSRLELEYRLAVPRLAELRSEIKARGLSVDSTHNFCPFPVELEGRLKPSDNLFNLAVPERDERRWALDYTQRTLDLAAALEAGAVVLPLGWVPE